MVTSWINENRLRLNDEETEVLIPGRPNILKTAEINNAIFGNHKIALANHV